MKYKIILISQLVFVFPFCKAQENEVKLNQLLAPSSPAFNLLGISPETIERPTNPTDFALSINNASQNLSTIPSNYAMEIAPFWLLNAKNMRWENFVGNKFVDNLPQSMVISIGTTTTISKIDSSKVSQAALGFKMSLFRGKTNKEYLTWKDSVDKMLGDVNVLYFKILDSLQNNDKVYVTLMKPVLNPTTTVEEKKPFEEVASKYSHDNLEPKARTITYARTKNNYINHLAKSTNFTRVGWKLDFAGGVVIDFPKGDYYNKRTSRAAFWLTGGYDDPSTASFLGSIRVNSDYYTSMLNDSGRVVPFINSNIINFDAGLKFIYNLSEKFYVSFEAIVRNPIIANKKIYDDNHISYQKKTERWTLAFNYNVASNQNVCFTFGKNFTNMYDTKNTLIAYLTYIIGIGSKRSTE